MNEISTIPKKELNELLPRNLISEMDIDTEGTLTYEDTEDEIVDDLAYHPKPNSTETGKENKKERFYSDSSIHMLYQYQLRKQLAQQSCFYMPVQYNQMAYMNNMYIMNGYKKGERKKTYSNNNVNFFNNQSNGFYKKKHSSNDVLVQKGSWNSNKGKKKDVTFDKYEIEEYERYLLNLPIPSYDYICSQKGAREMQKNIMKLPLECKTVLINSLGTNISKPMMDVYGNYFIQELIQGCSQSQIKTILRNITDSFENIALDYSGTHVLQSLLDMVTSEEDQKLILSMIKGHELEMAYDNNATHVLQKMLSTIKDTLRCELNKVIICDMKNLSLDSNGICLIKKFMSTTTIEENKKEIIHILTDNVIAISQNPYGNYVIQFLFEAWGISQCDKMVDIIIENISMLSIQKYSSNVAEKIIELLDEEKREKLSEELFYNNKLMAVLKNKYGRYVLQKALKSMGKKQKEEIAKYYNNKSNLSSIEKSKLMAFISSCRV